MIGFSCICFCFNPHDKIYIHNYFQDLPLLLDLITDTGTSCLRGTVALKFIHCFQIFSVIVKRSKVIVITNCLHMIFLLSFLDTYEIFVSHVIQSCIFYSLLRMRLKNKMFAGHTGRLNIICQRHVFFLHSLLPILLLFLYSWSLPLPRPRLFFIAIYPLLYV